MIPYAQNTNLPIGRKILSQLARQIRDILCVDPIHVFQMGIIISIDIHDTFILCTMISFGSLNFVVDQLGELYLQDPELIV